MERVTEAISPFIDWSQVPEQRLALAAERGTRIHKWIEGHFMGKWQPTAQDIKGYIESFLQWVDMMVHEVVFVEKELICDCYQFYGHIDFVGRLKDSFGFAVIDWKSPVMDSPYWEAQISAYTHLVENHSGLDDEVTRCGALMLSPKGNMAKLKEYSLSPVAFNAFLSALNAKRFFTK